MRKWRLAVLNKPLQRNSTVKYKNKSILYISYIIIVELRCRCLFFVKTAKNSGRSCASKRPARGETLAFFFVYSHRGKPAGCLRARVKSL